MSPYVVILNKKETSILKQRKLGHITVIKSYETNTFVTEDVDKSHVQCTHPIQFEQ